MFTSLSDSAIFRSWFIIKQYFVLLPNSGINTKVSALVFLKQPIENTYQWKPLDAYLCLQKVNIGILLVTSFIPYLLFCFLIHYLFFHWKILSCFLWSTCTEWEIFCTWVFSVPTIASLQGQVLLRETTRLLSAALHVWKQLLLRLWKSLVWGHCGR